MSLALFVEIMLLAVLYLRHWNILLLVVSKLPAPLRLVLGDKGMFYVLQLMSALDLLHV